MNIQNEIKKEGIEVIKELNSTTVNSLSNKVAKALQNAFPDKNLDTKEISSNMQKLKMYTAKLPDGCSAKYFYKNKSIYFDENVSLNKLNDLIVHECIHYLQERTNKKGKVERLGFCDFTDSYLPGTGLNEAAVQLLASTCVKKKNETVTYFGMSFNTISPNFYPLECAIANQLNYLIGNNFLFDSTLYSNDNFEDAFVSLTSKKTFYKIYDNLDLLLDKQDYINELTAQNTTSNDKKAQNNLKKIEKLKLEIKSLFFETQDLIISSYFNSTINLVHSDEALEKYRTKLYGFRDVIASADGYSFYSKFYINKMMELEQLKENNYGLNTSMVVYKKGLFGNLFSKLKSLFSLSSQEIVTNNSNENFYD